jgi:hypothetical protein
VAMHTAFGRMTTNIEPIGAVSSNIRVFTKHLILLLYTDINLRVRDLQPQTSMQYPRTDHLLSAKYCSRNHSSGIAHSKCLDCIEYEEYLSDPFPESFQECSLTPFHIISLNSQPLRVAVKLTTNVVRGMSAGRQISSRNQNDTRVLGLWGRNGDIVGQISHGSDIPDRQLVSIDDDLDNLNVSRLHR